MLVLAAFFLPSRMLDQLTYFVQLAEVKNDRTVSLSEVPRSWPLFTAVLNHSENGCGCSDNARLYPT
jgi:hypothetical protein